MLRARDHRPASETAAIEIREATLARIVTVRISRQTARFLKSNRKRLIQWGLPRPLLN